MDDYEAKLNHTIQTYDLSAGQYVARQKAHGWWDNPDPNFKPFLPYLRPDALVLDIGCGPGDEVKQFRREGFRAYGLDRSIGMLTEAVNHAGAGFVLADMRRLPLGANSVDAVWMQASLLHLPRRDAPAAIGEVYRVLRPEGLTCISVKQGEGDQIQTLLAGQPRYFTYYQPDEVATIITDAGFLLLWQEVKEQPKDTWITMIARKLAQERAPA